MLYQLKISLCTEYNKCAFFFTFPWPCILVQTQLMTNMMHKFLIHLLQFSLTMHLSTNSVNDQHDAQIFNTFITIHYMFRAISCSFWGSQILLIQHLASSISVSDRLVHRLIKSSFSTLHRMVTRWEWQWQMLY